MFLFGHPEPRRPGAAAAVVPSRGGEPRDTPSGEDGDARRGGLHRRNRSVQSHGGGGRETTTTTSPIITTLAPVCSTPTNTPPPLPSLLPQGGSLETKTEPPRSGRYRSAGIGLVRYRLAPCKRPLYNRVVWGV